jgi:hypothetical protein
VIIFTESGIIDDYNSLLDIFSSDPVTFAYVKTQDEPRMAEQFGITGQGFVAYKPKRGKYAKASGDLKGFVESVLSGGDQKWIKVQDGLKFSQLKDEL